MKKEKFLLALTLIACACVAQAQDLLTAFDQYRGRDPQIQIASLAVTDAIAASKDARSAYFPTVSLASGSSWLSHRFLGDGYRAVVDSSQTNLQLNTSLAILDFSRSSAALAADHKLKSTEHALTSVANSGFLDLAKSYIEVLLAQENLKTAQVAKQTLAEFARSIEIGRATGLYSNIDVLDSKLKLATAGSDLADAENNLIYRTEQLKRLTGSSTFSAKSLQWDALPLLFGDFDKEEVVSAIVQRHPDILSLKELVSEAKEKIAVQRAEFLPRISMSAQWQKPLSNSLDYSSSSAEGSSISVGLTVPLFGYGAFARADRTDAAYRTAIERLNLQTFNLTRDIERSYIDVTTQISKVSSLSVSVATAEELAKASLEGMRLGLRSTTDVLQSQRDLVEAKRNLANSKYSSILNFLNLCIASGKISADGGTRFRELVNAFN